MAHRTFIIFHDHGKRLGQVIRPYTARESVTRPIVGMIVEIRQVICNSIRVYFVSFLLESLKPRAKVGL